MQSVQLKWFILRKNCHYHNSYMLYHEDQTHITSLFICYN